MGDAQMAQYLSAGVAGAPQRGQIMFTLLVKTEPGSRASAQSAASPGEHTVGARGGIKKK
jgi:hypothetical protein